MTPHRLFYFALLLALVLPISGCTGRTSSTGGTGSATTQQTQGSIRLLPPVIPALLTDPVQRAEYLAEHYWQNFDFADTTLIHNADYTEQAFVDFIYLLANVSETSTKRAAESLLSNASANPVALDHFTQLAEQYLYDPNSPMRNEELYIPVLEAIIALPSVDSLLKIRPRHQLDMALKNRPGMVATDFTYTTSNGTTGRLSGMQGDYTLILFYDPDCPDCKRVKQYITDSEVFGELIAGQSGKASDDGGGKAINEGNIQDGKRLSVLAIYPDNDIAAWRAHLSDMPTVWSVGYDKGSRIRETELYDLKAIPTLYLLDRNKHVLLKDASVEQIEAWLGQNE